MLQFDEYVRSLQIDPCSPHFCLVTDGQYPLRQCLHPESCSKNIDLAPYYNVFHDLRKDFRAFYSAPEHVNSIKEMISCILLEAYRYCYRYRRDSRRCDVMAGFLPGRASLKT